MRMEKEESGTRNETKPFFYSCQGRKGKEPKEEENSATSKVFLIFSFKYTIFNSKIHNYVN